MRLRLLATLLTALILAACSQGVVTPLPEATLGTNGVTNDTYTIDFEDAPTSKEKIRVIWDVAVGRGVTYEGENKAITDKIGVDGYNVTKGKKVGGNSAVVISGPEESGKVLFVFPRIQNFQGVQLEIKPSQAFGGPSKGKNGLVTLKGITVYLPEKASGNIVLYGNGKFIKKISLKKAALQKLELDEPGVGFIQVNTSSLVAIDDVIFEVPAIP